MGLRYQTGEDIQQGDRVMYRGNPGVIVLVIEALTGEPEEDWLLGTLGTGIMLVEPKVFGRVYLNNPHEEGDFHLIGRAE